MSRRSKKSERERILAELQSCEDSDDDSEIPPPPPPLPDDLHYSSVYSSERDQMTPLQRQAKTNSTSPGVVSTGVSFQDDTHISMENSRNAEDDIRRPYDITETGSGTGKHVPLRGHFQGQSKAQEFDEEEAATDEIEVPTSRVVRRMTRQEQLNKSQCIERASNTSIFSSISLWNKKKGKFWFGVISCILVVLAISLGVAFATMPRKKVRDDSPARNWKDETIDSTFSRAPAQSEPTKAPSYKSFNPQIPISESLNNVVMYLSDLGVKGLDVKPKDKSSPKFQALDWLLNDTVITKYFANSDFLKMPLAQLDIKQRFVASTIFFATNAEEEWKNSDGWLSDRNICEWHGISCGWTPEGQQIESLDRMIVTELDLTGNKLIGIIPSELSLFTSITNLKLRDNWLEGPVPTELYQLVELRELDLSLNTLNGQLLPDIELLTKLEVLNIKQNYFTGSIPFSSISKIFTLKILHMGKNKFNENPQIPLDVVNLKNLRELDLDDLNIAGTLPEEIGNLFKLEKLVLNHNFISGTIPNTIGNLKMLKELLLHENYLSNTLPIEIGTLKNLKELVINNNKLSGAIPIELGAMDSLVSFIASNNKFSTIPAELGKLQFLQKLDVTSNNIEGQIPDEWGSMGWYSDGGKDHMNELYLGDNSFTGKLPSFLGLLTELTVLHVENNDLSGEIPKELGALMNLEHFVLAENNFSGVLPADLGYLKELTVFDVGGNKLLKGEIPTELESLNKLKSFVLTDNEFTGILPAFLGLFTDLTLLDVENNKFRGEIPTELGTLQKLETLVLSYNWFSSTIPSQFKEMENIRDLHLSVNVMEGELPYFIGDLWKLEDIQLDDNLFEDFSVGFSGTIPRSIGNLENLRILRLRKNSMSGPLPTELGDLKKLEVLLINNNLFEGEIPPAIGNLNSLVRFEFEENAFKGLLPNSVCSLGLNVLKTTCDKECGKDTFCDCLCE